MFFSCHFTKLKSEEIHRIFVSRIEKYIYKNVHRKIRNALTLDEMSENRIVDPKYLSQIIRESSLDTKK